MSTVTSLALFVRNSACVRKRAGSFFAPPNGRGLRSERRGVARCLRQHNPELLIAMIVGPPHSLKSYSIKRAGIDVIVLDHHEPKSELPDCLLVNPKTTNPGSITLQCRLTFKLCHPSKTPPHRFRSETLLTSSHSALSRHSPLRGDNRVFVRSGSTMIERSVAPELRS